MADHPLPEDVAAKASHQRNESRSPNPILQNKLHIQRGPNSTGSSMLRTIPGYGLGGNEGLHANAPGNTGIVKEGLGSLDRWSQSTTSSKSPPNRYMGHGRGNSAISGFDVYDDQDTAGVLATSGTNTIPGKSDHPFGSSAFHKQLRGSHSPQRSQTSEPEESSTLDLSWSATSPILPPNDADSNTVNDSENNVVQYPEGETAGEDGSSFADTADDRLNRHRSHSQKAMLSRALQKANTAVLLDNAANFEGAMGAYNDACELLQLVMQRSSGGTGEKLKLQEIRDTYMIRVNELQGMELSYREPDSKALPERPLSDQSYGVPLQPLEREDRPFSGGNTDPPLQPEPQPGQTVPEEPRAVTREQIPPRHQSLVSSPLDDELRFMTVSPNSKGLPDQSLSEPLPNTHLGPQNSTSSLSNPARATNGSTSWLDTIDESGPSSPSSMHSETSSLYLRRRTSSHDSHGTESEFDAALDAAVEAAYDEGFEPAMGLGGDASDDDIVANARRNVELAKQKVREAEREAAMALGRGREWRYTPQKDTARHSNHAPDYLDEESEEEERLLEEMTSGYVMDDFEFGLQSKSALPRQSDSSGASGATGDIPAASNSETAGVALSTLVEDGVLSSADQGSAPGVRARRLSGKNSRDLRIETSSRGTTDPVASGTAQSSTPLSGAPPPVPKDGSQDSYKSMAAPSALRHDVDRRDPSAGAFTEGNVSNANLSRAPTQEDEHSYANIPSTGRTLGKVPSAPDNLGKRNPSLNAMRARNASMPTPDAAADSPSTPSSNAFPGVSTGAIPGLLSSAGATFTPDGLPSGGMHLFDSHIHSPTTPGSPNASAPNAPIPLEPCPESFLLRPFWLMRCIYESIAHPCGGYLSTKLFVPRDIWRVKNVKLKAVEEKVSNCDLLTAALLKLAQVDTFDADAVLEEMQSLESVLDQVQASLSKKLGSDVGVQGAMPLFKLSPVSDDAAPSGDALPSKSSTAHSKSYLTSWRKLRSKNSGVGGVAPPPISRETSKDNLTISSIPMSSSSNSPPIKRNVMQLQVSGPNSHYMAALARLCDAAQVIDQIAQQVEDPGLKHTSPTLVGLELSTRHAAEFFGFYVCRFAMIDIAMMLDKFVKRGSEWVLV